MAKLNLIIEGEIDADSATLPQLKESIASLVARAAGVTVTRMTASRVIVPGVVEPLDDAGVPITTVRDTLAVRR